MMQESKQEMDLDLRDLDSYHGTEGYHMGFFGVRCTDGINYISLNGYSWFVTDAIAVIRTKLSKEEFLSIKLNVNEDKTALLRISDGNNKILYSQTYKYTDARKNLNLFYADNVLMLSSEY